jgi:hypothetical protein
LPFWRVGKSYAYYEKDIYPYRTLGAGVGNVVDGLQSVFGHVDSTDHRQQQRDSACSYHASEHQQVRHFSNSIGGVPSRRVSGFCPAFFISFAGLSAKLNE